MQRDLGRTVEPDIDNAGTGTGGGIPLQSLILPGATAERAGAAGVAHQGQTARQADLPAMGMPAEHQVEIGMCSMLVDQMSYSLENIRLVGELSQSRDAVIRGIGASSDGRAKSVYAPVPEGQARAIERATQLLIDIAGGKAGPTTVWVQPPGTPLASKLVATGSGRSVF